ncbi:MAG: M56 family metallopeptidase [Planctomycetales bacterium]
MNLASLLSDFAHRYHEFPVRLTVALFHLLWEGAIIGLLSAVLAIALRRRSAHLRYALQVALLAIFAACLPVTLALVTLPSRPNHLAGPADTYPALIVSPAERSATRAASQIGSTGLRPADDIAPETTNELRQPFDPLDSNVATAPPNLMSEQRWARLLETVAPLATGLYFAGVAAMMLRLLAGLWGGHRLRGAAVALNSECLSEIVRRQARLLGLKSAPAVGWCARVSTPIVMGLLRPMILVPAALEGGLTADQWCALLTHELAHIRRFDLLVNLLQRSVEAALFFHPAVYAVSRQVSRERENCCDDLVLESGGESVTYGGALVRMAELCIPRFAAWHRLTSLAASGDRPSELKRRVLRLLGIDVPSSLRLSWMGLALLALGISLTLLGPLYIGSRLWANAERPQSSVAAGDATVKNAPPMGSDEQELPAAAMEATIHFAQTEFWLGESIAVEYQMVNRGDQPAPYARGAYYTALRTNDAYRLRAVRIDDQGEPIGRWFPTPEDPQGAEGTREGPAGGWLLQPHESRDETLFVTRSVRFSEPGRYRIRIDNVNRQTGAVLARGEVVLTLKQPNPDQAREVYRRMKRAPRKEYDDNAMQFLAEAADFETMHQPVYLPILKEFADAGDVDALPSLERMERIEASEVLVAGITRAVDGDRPLEGLPFLRHLRASLPFPNWYDPASGDWDRARRELSARTWKPAFGPVLTRFARQLTNAAKETALDETTNPKERQQQVQSLLGEIDYIYRCVGQASDLKECLRAYALAIDQTKTLPFETHQYFRPRGAAFGFSHSVVRILRRGGRAPVQPAHPGEAAVFAIALRVQDDFRPAAWPEAVMDWLQRSLDQELPYLAELILDHLPQPMPQGLLDDVLKFIPQALAHSYIDLQIAACKLAEKHPQEAFREPLKTILESATEEHLIQFATAAAKANGVEPQDDAAVTLPDHLNVVAVRFSQEGRTLTTVATEHDVSIRVWDVPAARLVRTVPLATEHHGNFFLNGTLRLSADARIMAAFVGETIDVWDAATGRLQKILEIPGRHVIRALAISDDGTLIAAGGTQFGGLTPADAPQPVFVWDVRVGELITQMNHKGALQIHQLAFSRDGRFLASASQENGTMVFDLEQRQTRHALKNDNAGQTHPEGPFPPSALNQVLALAFSPDGRLLATGDILGVKLWDLTTSQLVRTIQSPFRYGRSVLLFSPDGAELLRADADKVVRLWEVSTGNELLSLKTPSNCAAFSPDGRWLGVGFSDAKQALRVFDLTQSGR